MTDNPQSAAQTDEQTNTTGTRALKTKQKREKSGIAFPYEDLNTAIKLASLAHHTYGGECTMDQLAAAAKASTTSGAFRGRVGAGRQFGILGGVGAHVTMGPHGLAAIDEDNVGARADAFLNVALYRELFNAYKGTPLPNDAGLEARMRDLGVPAKQLTTARQVFMRSAEQAGFFIHGRGRLVMPPRGTMRSLGDPTSDAGGRAGEQDDTTRNGDNSGGPAIMNHPLIVGLLAALPEPGQEFDANDKELWLKTLEMNLSVIYKPTRKSPPTATPPRGVSSPLPSQP